jgi:putative phage-type endonuclease
MTNAEPEVITVGTAVLAGEYEDGSPEWHAQRRNVIGGSEIGSIMGVNNFQSGYVLWYKKAGLIPDGNEENPLFEWGHRLEPALAQKFADEHPEFRVLKSGSFVHQDRPWHGANPDRLLAPVYEYVDEETGEISEFEGETEAVLEIKTSMNGYGWENDKCPVKYVGQLRWYLECFGFEYGYLIVLANLGDYREFLVPRDPSKPVISGQTGEQEWYSIGGEEMLEAGRHFFESLPGKATDQGVPPDPDSGKDSYELIRTFHPDILDKEIVLDEEFVAEIRAAQEAEAAATAELQRVKNVLLERMGKFRKAVIGEGKNKQIVARRTSRNGGSPYLVFI